MNSPHRMGDERAPTMFPHTATVYLTGDEDPITFKKISHITVLEGVFYDSVKAVNVRESGLANADSANLLIPCDVKATNGETGEGQTYLPPKEYEISMDKAKHWTILAGDNCFFVKGTVVRPELSFQQINASFDFVHKVTVVDPKDFGGLPHFEVGGA